MNPRPLPQVELSTVNGVHLIRIDGPLTLDGLVGAIQTRVADPEFYDGMPALWDFRQADATAISVPDMRRLGAFAVGISAIHDTRVAVVVSRPTEFGIARQWMVHGGRFGQQRNVFYTMDEGWAWVHGTQRNT